MNKQTKQKKLDERKKTKTGQDKNKFIRPTNARNNDNNNNNNNNDRKIIVMIIIIMITITIIEIIS